MDMTEPQQPATSPQHAAHDPMWIAALAARDPDLSPSALVWAGERLASCADCADLLADLVAVTAAIPDAATPARPRDFTLTTADADRLRPIGWRRFLGFIGSARDGVSRPLALGFTTLGLAGLLLATLPNVLIGGSATGGAILSTVGASVESGQEAAPAAAPATDLYLMSAEPGVSRTDDGSVFSGGSEEDAMASDGELNRDITALDEGAPIIADRTGWMVLVIAAGTLLLSGLGLFGLRWSTRQPR